MSFVAPDFGADGRCVHVTRTFFPKNGTSGHKNEEIDSEILALESSLGVGVLYPKTVRQAPELTSRGSFLQTIGHIDWLSIKQTHLDLAEPLPVINNGCVIAINAEGELERTTFKSFEIEGSYESNSFLRCDGVTVEYSGNPARWGRMDNVFGYHFGPSLMVVNQILASQGLPPFTAGRAYETVNAAGDVVKVWTGAIITRVDLTQNYLTGSPDDAQQFIRWLRSQTIKGKKTDHYGDTTVDFGRGSKRSYFKIYNKGAELLKHSKTKTDVSTIYKQERADSIEKLADWCLKTGLVRAELELKAKSLRDLNCYYLGDFHMAVIEVEFRKHTSVFERATAEIDELANLDNKTLSVYRMWQAGDFIKHKLSKSVFYRRRALLLPYGIDIAIESNVKRFEPKTRVISLSAAVPPDWYSLPPVKFQAA